MRRAVLVCLLLASCSEGLSAVSDASMDAPTAGLDDAAAGTSNPLAVDFTVAGCPNLDPNVPRCTGKAPLTLEFVAVTTPNVTRYIWKLNDGLEPGNAATVSHTYQTPGTYSVTLTGVDAAGNLTTKPHAGFVVVEASTTGEPCDRDKQCAAGTCMCSSSRPCAVGPSAGLCAAECTTNTCASGEVCADLGVAVASSGRAEPWQTQLCLRACATDRDCPAPLHCRSLPGISGGPWVKGCFSDVPADMASPCRDAHGVRRNELCATGLCADLGALGLCSADCAQTSCPVGSDCAVFGDGRQLCLVPCSLSFGCATDPLMSCVAPGTALLGYQLKNNAATNGTTHCAPKACASDKDCAPTGSCQLAGANGRCVQRN